MKNITLLTAILTLGFLFAGCGGGSGSDTNREVTRPDSNRRTESTVKLRSTGDTKGDVSYIDLEVIFPADTTQSLFDYTGDATIRGTIQASYYPCIRERSSFNCKASLAAGSITAQSCSIRNSNFYIHITVLRGKKLKESYSIYYAEANTHDFGCYAPR